MILEDYCYKISSLHIYPADGFDLELAESQIILDLTDVVNVLRDTIVHTSFPNQVLSSELLTELMHCQNLRTIRHNPRGMYQSAKLCRGSDKEAIISFRHGPFVIGHPWQNLAELDILLPHAGAGASIFNQMDLPSLRDLTIRITTIYRDPKTNYIIGSLLLALLTHAPGLINLSIFATTIFNTNLQHYPRIQWDDLQHLIGLVGLESFQLIHPRVVNISDQHLVDVLSGLPRIRKFILNPHPMVHSESTFGVDVLHAIAQCRPEIEELGIFFNKTANSLPPVVAYSLFPFLTTLYVGTSVIERNKVAFRNTCRWLHSILPDNIDIDHYPPEFSDICAKRSYITHSGGSIADNKMTNYVQSIQLWQDVVTALETIREMKIEISSW